MDRLSCEFLPPLIVADRLAEARREALADPLPPAPNSGERLALFLGNVLILIGCRLDAAARRRTAAIPLTLSPSPCGHGK